MAQVNQQQYVLNEVGDMMINPQTGHAIHIGSGQQVQLPQGYAVQQEYIDEMIPEVESRPNTLAGNYEHTSIGL